MQFMWIDQPLTQGEKVYVLKLEAEIKKLRATLLSTTTTLHNVKAKVAQQRTHVREGVVEEDVKVALLVSYYMLYAIILGMLMSLR